MAMLVDHLENSLELSLDDQAPVVKPQVAFVPADLVDWWITWSMGVQKLQAVRCSKKVGTCKTT